MEKLTINQWAEEDRPREKMMRKGAEALSDAELLAILIGSGNTEESAVSLMQRVLSTCGNDLNQLGKWEVQDFSSFKGFGPAKSITIMAAWICSPILAVRCHSGWEPPLPIITWITG